MIKYDQGSQRRHVTAGSMDGLLLTREGEQRKSPRLEACAFVEKDEEQRLAPRVHLVYFSPVTMPRCLKLGVPDVNAAYLHLKESPCLTG